MPTNLSLTMKAQLLAACRHQVAQQVANATQAMNAAQQAANEEGKSSAGDKYETTRAMMQIERDQAATQLAEALKLQHVLDNLPLEPSTKVSPGSLVITEKQKFFVAVGLGRVVVDGIEFLVVGPASPVGKALMGLGVGGEATFNKQVLKVVEVL